jgi:serine/threonine protein kinase
VTPSPARPGGATPLYASPETFQGSLSRQSDQYSLAIVYQQLLTGTVPFWSPNVYQLILQHLSGTPNLTVLPAADQPAVARALSKSPEDRFPSCQEFVRSLLAVPAEARLTPPVPTRAAAAAASAATRPTANPTVAAPALAPPARTVPDPFRRPAPRPPTPRWACPSRRRWPCPATAS